VLSVVIPATDDPPSLGRCLAALRRSGVPYEVEVVREPRGAGPAAARNAGVRRTAGDVVVFVDSDVAVHPDALRRLSDALERDASLHAVFGAYDAQPDVQTAVSRFRNLLHHHVHASAPGRADTFWAGLGAIRRETFEAAGGFDAGRFPRPSIEDVELGLRITGAGARIELDPAVRGTHLKHWTLRSMLRTDFGARGVPWVALALERGEAGTSLNLGWRQRAAALSAVGLVAASVARRPRLAALGLLAMLVPNARFYGLLARSGGPRLVAAGIPLHLMHHLVAVAAVPVGAAVWLRGKRT
jgi:GT2 family glycosyltransferase